MKNSLSDFSKIFNDTKGFDNLINNLKSEKNQIDKLFDKQQKENDNDGDEFEFENLCWKLILIYLIEKKMKLIF